MITPITTITNYPNSKQNIPFKANPFTVLKYAINTKKNVDTGFMKTLLGLNPEIMKAEEKMGITNPLKDINKPFKKYRGGFFIRLAKKYSEERFYNKIQNETEHRQLVYDIYNNIKSPTQLHKSIIERDNFSLKELKSLFEISKEKPFLLKLVDNILNIECRNKSKCIKFEDLIEILNSNYAKDMNKNFDKHKPYIKLALQKSEQESFVQNLNNYFFQFKNKS